MEGTGATNERGSRTRGATAGTYLAVWLGLLAATALTVTSASLPIGRLVVVVVLAIAAGKSVLVLLYFMNLRWERRLVIRLLVPIALATLAVFIGLTYTDMLNR